MAKDDHKSQGDSDSPLATRRGNADPVDIDDSPLGLEFGPRGDYENTMEPTAPISESGAEAT